MEVKGYEFQRESGTKLESCWPCSKKNQFGCKCNVKMLKGRVYESSYKHNHEYKICFKQKPETISVNLEAPVQTQEMQDNSDDDVIEVVRDEAPIEILSDGEELEIQLQHSQDILKGIVIENVFPPENAVEKNKDPVEDPLKPDSHNNFCSDLFNALNPPSQPDLISNSVPIEMGLNTKIAVDTKECDPKELSVNATATSKENTPDNCERIETIVPNDDVLIGTKARLVEHEGRSVLMVNKHRFMRHYTSRGGRTRWRCCKSFNKCLAIAITYDNQIVKLNDIHNHEPFSPVKKGRKPRNQNSFENSAFNLQSSHLEMPSFRCDAPFPTLEISPLDDSNDKYSSVSERIVVKPCEDLFG